MALKYIDGFGWLGADDQDLIGNRWTASNGNNTILTGAPGPSGPPFTDTQALRVFNNGAGKTYRPTLVDTGAGDRLIVGFRFRTNSDATNPIVRINQDASIRGTLGVVGSPPKLRWVRGSSLTTNIVLTTTETFSLNQWYYVELEVLASFTGGTGSVKIAINGGTPAEASSADTFSTANTSNRIRLESTSSSFTNDFTDLYIADSTGSGVTAFIGDVQVVTAEPDTDEVTDWTLTGEVSHFLALDEVNAAHDETSYIETSTTSQESVHKVGYPRLTINGTDTLYGVQIGAAARDTTSGAPQIELGVGTDTVPTTPAVLYGSAQTLPTGSAYGTFFEVFETDPDSGVAWVQGSKGADSGVEGMNIRVRSA